MQFQSLEPRQLLAADGFEATNLVEDDSPLADITGLWVTVADREYFTSERAAVTIDMNEGETLQVTGIQYRVGESMSEGDGVIAFESYVRREHGASATGSFDYTNGRFANPTEQETAAGQLVVHQGFDSGWQLDVIDNRVAVVAIRYFGDEFVIEDRMMFDVNVVVADDNQTWTDAINPLRASGMSMSKAPQEIIVINMAQVSALFRLVWHQAVGLKLVSMQKPFRKQRGPTDSLC